MVEEVVLAWVMVSLAGFELRARFYFGDPSVPRDPRLACLYARLVELRTGL